jgi:pilus assembly protein CpaF
MNGALVEQLTDRLREQFTLDGAAASPVAVASALRAEPSAAVLGDTTLLRLADRVHSDLAGAGPLAPLLAEPAVTDVLVNGLEVWIDRGQGLQRGPILFRDTEEVRRLAQRMAAAAGRRLDDGSPFVDARLPDGTRLHAVLPPIAAQGPCLSLRTFRQRPFVLGELVPTPVAEVLAAILSARLSFLICGGTGSGKTTLLAAMLGLVPATERIVLVEDSAELRPRHPHVVGLQCRTSNVEGAGAVTVADLVRQALRMRPDRLVVGECRGPEVVDLLAALNTGHEGGAGTLHANTAKDVPARMEALGLAGGLDRIALHAQLAAALNVVVHLRRGPRGRVLDEICVLLPFGGQSLVTAVSAWRQASGPGLAAAHLAELIAARGVRVPPLLTGPAEAPTTVLPPVAC